jgi:chaperone BCS1
MSTPTDLTVAQPGSGVQLWPEALDTPGLIPSHMKRAGAASIPILEVFQRILYRLHPRGRASDLELALAALGLWQAIRPAYQHLRDFFFWAATVQITIPESDAVSREVLTWMGSEVIAKSRARSAMLVTGGMENLNNNFPHQMRFPGPAGGGGRLDDEVLCLPPLGTRLFWVGFRPFLFTRSGGTNIHRNTILSGNMLNDQGQLANALTITTLGWSLKPLQKFTELCHEYKLNNLTGTTQVYFAGGHSDPYGDGWQSVSKAIRRLDTIDMDEEVKSDIIRDAEYYYSEQS